MTTGLIFDHLAALSDPTRCRMLLLLERHELTVSELCAVLQLPQSTVSRHLKTLADEGWLSSRRDGTSRFYALAPEAASPELAQLWEVVRGQVGQSEPAAQDRHRLRTVFARRRTRSQEFFASAAAEWDRLRLQLFGGAFFGQALLGLLDETWTVGDLGCGTGEAAAMLAPVVRQVVAVDGSPDMLEAARVRLAGVDNVDLREGELEALPIADGALDAVIVMLVLHHLPEPLAALAEARRVLAPGGRLVVVDMLPHGREEYKRRMGHVWLGFSSEQVERLLAGTGFESVRVRALPPDPEARGPALFAATARRSAPRATYNTERAESTEQARHLERS